MYSSDTVRARARGGWCRDRFGQAADQRRPGPVADNEESGENEWKVEAVLNARRAGRGFQFLVKWAGYRLEECMYLPGRNPLT